MHAAILNACQERIGKGGSDPYPARIYPALDLADRI